MPDQHLTSHDDVEAILRLAVQADAVSTLDLRQQLEQSAQELGISPEVLARAEDKFNAQREEHARLEAEEFKKRLAREARLKSFMSNVLGYLGINALLHTINFLASPHAYWAIWPLLGMGIGIVKQGSSLLTRQDSVSENEEEGHHVASMTSGSESEPSRNHPQ